MKRIFTIFLVFILIFSLSSCVLKPAKTEPENTTQEENVEDIIEEISETIEVNAGVFWYDFSDAFLTTVRDALNAELDALGITYTNYDAASVQIEQISQIDEAIKNGTNLLIVNIVDTASIDIAQSIVNIAKVADVPIIFFNREVADEVINSYENACFVGTRIEEAGEAQGKMAGQYILENYDEVDLNSDGYISYIMFKGELGHPNAECLTQYSVATCNEVLKKAGMISLACHCATSNDHYEACNWDKNTAFEHMEAALTINPLNSDDPIEIVLANNDDMALGSIEALNNIGWNTGEEGAPFIPVFGVDYTADAQAAIDAGKMTGSILQSASGMAKTVADLVENVMNGNHVFDNAVDNFNVDENVNKIRVPYEIKM